MLRSKRYDFIKIVQLKSLIDSGKNRVNNCVVFLNVKKAIKNHRILFSKLKGYKIKCSMLIML